MRAEAKSTAILRQAAAEQLPDIMLMMAEFHADDPLPWHPDRAENAIRDLIARPDWGIFWLIEEDGQVIGLLVLTFGFSIEFHGRFALIDEFYIRPQYRGRGIGTHALNLAMEYCAAHKLSSAHLEVEHASPARRLYDRAGFHDRGFYLMTKWV